MLKAPKKGIKWEKFGFGFSDVNCHLRMTWKNGKWSKPTFVKDPWIKMHIGAACLHYGQECFEGIKAFRQKDGKVVIFRPDENAKRMFRTAERTCMPPVPVETFIDCCKAIVKKNAEFVPPYGTGGSMYLRPLLIGTGPQIGVAPAHEYTFMIMVMPVGAYYKGGLKPVRAVIYDEYDRAAPQGMGDVKVGGNYAAGIFAHEKAKHNGWPVELYLDAKTHKKVECRPIPYTEIKKFQAVAALGTAVVITPVWEITRNKDVIKISDPTVVHPTLQKLYDTVQGIQYGVLEDKHKWCFEVK